MITVCIYNQKGGTGKTTTAVQLAYYLEKRGRAVCLWDLDGQADGTRYLGGDDGGPTIADVLTGRVAAADAIKGSQSGPDLMPGTANLMNVNTALTSTQTLRRVMESTAGAYDVAIIDNAPTAGPLLANVLTASDWVVIPVMTDTPNLAALTADAGLLEAVRAGSNPGLRLAGIVVNAYEKRSIFTRDVLETFRTAAAQLGTKLYNPAIRKDVKIMEAAALGVSVFDHAPRSRAAHDMAAVYRQIMEDIGA